MKEVRGDGRRAGKYPDEVVGIGVDELFVRPAVAVANTEQAVSGSGGKFSKSLRKPARKAMAVYSDIGMMPWSDWQRAHSWRKQQAWVQGGLGLTAEGLARNGGAVGVSHRYMGEFAKG